MDRPIEIHCHGMEHSDNVHAYVTNRVTELDHIHGHLSGCRVHIEQPHKHRQTHKGWKVMVAISLPRRGDLVMHKSCDHHDSHDNLYKLLDECFDSLTLQLRELVEIDRGEVKTHPEQAVQAVVRQLFDDHGFLQTHDGREFYFHRNSVLHGRFPEMSIGSGVTFSEEEGDEGPQASTVHLLVR